MHTDARAHVCECLRALVCVFMQMSEWNREKRKMQWLYLETSDIFAYLSLTHTNCKLVSIDFFIVESFARQLVVTLTFEPLIPIERMT